MENINKAKQFAEENNYQYTEYLHNGFCTLKKELDAKNIEIKIYMQGKIINKSHTLEIFRESPSLDTNISLKTYYSTLITYSDSVDELLFFALHY